MYLSLLNIQISQTRFSGCLYKFKKFCWIFFLYDQLIFSYKSMLEVFNLKIKPFTCSHICFLLEEQIVSSNRGGGYIFVSLTFESACFHHFLGSLNLKNVQTPWRHTYIHTQTCIQVHIYTYIHTYVILFYGNCFLYSCKWNVDL